MIATFKMYLVKKTATADEEESDTVSRPGVIHVYNSGGGANPVTDISPLIVIICSCVFSCTAINLVSQTAGNQACRNI